MKEYTKEDSRIIKDAALAKWRWFERTGRLEGVNEKGRVALFERALDETWEFLHGGKSRMPIDLLLGTLKQVEWRSPEVETLLELAEKEETKSEEDAE